MYFEFIESYFYEFGMPKRLFELIAKNIRILNFMFQTLFFVTGFSPSYNLRM
jgi:hypothetical protein